MNQRYDFMPKAKPNPWAVPAPQPALETEKAIDAQAPETPKTEQKKKPGVRRKNRPLQEDES